jgi:hypothetical protein
LKYAKIILLTIGTIFPNRATLDLKTTLPLVGVPSDTQFEYLLNAKAIVFLIFFNEIL